MRTLSMFPVAALTALVPVAAAVLSSGCATDYDKLWSRSSADHPDQVFSSCDKREDKHAVLYECGLRTLLATSTSAKVSHVQFVEAEVAEAQDDPFSGVLGEVGHNSFEWGSGTVEVSLVAWGARPDTIIQPSMDVYASQVVGNRRQVFHCSQPLVMIPDDDELTAQFVECVNGVKAMALASQP